MDNCPVLSLMTDVPPAVLHAIQCAQTHPDSKLLEDYIMDHYGDVLFEQHLARDVDLETRGPWGLAKIELLPGATAKKKKPFRMPQEIEEPLRSLLDKFRENGWIEPSISD